MIDYQPVDCGIYSAHEPAILQHRKLLLSSRDSDATVTGIRSVHPIYQSVAARNSSGLPTMPVASGKSASLPEHKLEARLTNPYE
jgi:hypothetical protein